MSAPRQGQALAERLARKARQAETIRRQRYLAMQLGRSAGKHGE
jgi:hypothetical protein